MVKKAKTAAKTATKAGPTRIDLACGDNKREGFYGVDRVKTASTDAVVDLLTFPWPWACASVDEFHSSHFFEHVPKDLRFRFFDELFRCLRVGGTAHIIVPYYASMRAIQDPTHEWPPIAETSFLYANKQWRDDNKLSHYPVSCDFDYTIGYAVNGVWTSRSEESRAFAFRHYINTIDDLVVTMTKRAASPAEAAKS